MTQPPKSQFHPLTVTDVQKTTPEAVVVTLEATDGSDFTFQPGQYLTFRRDFDGVELRRSYSICASPQYGTLQVGIKRVAGGAFSTWANTALTAGQQIDAMRPMGNFFATDANPDPHLLAVAAGSGITPILSIVASALATGTAQVTLVYANRNLNTVMFRERLEDLKNSYMDRLNVVHILSDGGQEVDLFSGRLTAEKCAQLFDRWIDVTAVTMAYICGPVPMMETVAASLAQAGVDRDLIRLERFGTGQPGRARVPAPATDTAVDGVAGQVTLGGATRSLVIPAGVSLLEAALANSLDAPFACKAGVCSTCKAKVVSGQVEMVANHALEDHEVEDGFVLTCQCYPATSAQVVWDYDQAGH